MRSLLIAALLSIAIAAASGAETISQAQAILLAASLQGATPAAQRAGVEQRITLRSGTVVRVSVKLNPDGSVGVVPLDAGAPFASVTFTVGADGSVPTIVAVASDGSRIETGVNDQGQVVETAFNAAGQRTGTTVAGQAIEGVALADNQSSDQSDDTSRNDQSSSLSDDLGGGGGGGGSNGGLNFVDGAAPGQAGAGQVSNTQP